MTCPAYAQTVPSTPDIHKDCGICAVKAFQTSLERIVILDFVQHRFTDLAAEIPRLPTTFCFTVDPWSHFCASTISWVVAEFQMSRSIDDAALNLSLTSRASQRCLFSENQVFKLSDC
eukprot:6148302-Amphidinium_carterae.1